MKNLLKLAPILILCFVVCTSNPAKTEQAFGDFVGIDEIDGAEIVNNSGKVSLNYQQLEKLKKELAKLTLQPGEDIKVGAKGLKFTKAKHDYFLATRTNGKLAELTMPNGKSMVFNLNGLNLDNYKNENIKVTTWIDDFKSFRTAVYRNNITKLKTYFKFPFDDEGKTIFHLCELTESD